MIANPVALYVQAVAQGQLAVRALVLSGPGAGNSLCVLRAGTRAGSLGSAHLDAAAEPHVQRALATQQPARVEINADDATATLFLDVSAPPPRLIVVGAVHTAIALVTFANVLGFQTIVLDARAAFATPARFGHAAALQIGWPADALAALRPDESTYIVVLTHDAKIDDPALACALQTPARYIGALGSRRTHEKRLHALRDLGVSDADLSRVHAPIGLDLGGRTPEEIALAIMAEIVLVKNGR